MIYRSMGHGYRSLSRTIGGMNTHEAAVESTKLHPQRFITMSMRRPSSFEPHRNDPHFQAITNVGRSLHSGEAV